MSGCATTSEREREICMEAESRKCRETYGLKIIYTRRLSQRYRYGECMCTLYMPYKHHTTACVYIYIYKQVLLHTNVSRCCECRQHCTVGVQEGIHRLSLSLTHTHTSTRCTQACTWWYTDMFRHRSRCSFSTCLYVQEEKHRGQ